MTDKTHYNWFALRDRYLLSKNKLPLMTDERYCEIEGIDPEVYAYSKDRMRDYFISKQDNPKEGAKQYDLFLAHNGILNKEEY
ncbi:hypothetical protein PQZ39_01615 [bacterium]|nr:hypothetical protein [bacterium]